jgi:hypothetical protein
MAAIATDPNTEINLRFQAFKELAQYLYPKRKAIEVCGEDEEPLSAVSAPGTDSRAT